MPDIKLWQEASIILIPLVLAFILQSHWTSQTKKYLAVGLAVVVAAIGQTISGVADWQQPASAILYVVIGSQGVYLLFKNQIDALAKATDVTQPSLEATIASTVAITKRNGTYITEAKTPPNAG
jgi:hypothetical protein